MDIKYQYKWSLVDDKDVNADASDICRSNLILYRIEQKMLSFGRKQQKKNIGLCYN